MVNKLDKKIIVILGPTSSGKTRVSVKLAADFNGEIVSADSRQVYRGMDIGTGKDLEEYQTGDIPYHLIDVADPSETFNLAEYQKKALAAINDIITRKKVPIIVGGSGLYLQAIVDNYILPVAKVDNVLREKLEKMNVADLYEYLEKIDRQTAKWLNNSDRNNKRRLIRKIEIGLLQKEINPPKGQELFSSLVIGLDCPKDELYERIYTRLIYRLENQGMVDEVEKLYRNGISWQKLESFGLEYKYISQHLQNELSYRTMVDKLFIAIRQFAKKQMTWFRRWERQGRKIVWLNDYSKIKKTVASFLKK